jgi:predicted nucleic acid-binding protein
MIFWDSSAITPLLVTEGGSVLREDQLRRDPVMVIWYGTPAEIESALSRRKREGNLDREVELRARARLELLDDSWIEVQPTVSVRERAMRLLKVHSLRAADAFQLAAALIVCEERPRGFTFHSGDWRLLEAAEAEGFTIG